jgi:hypothetical protein
MTSTLCFVSQAVVHDILHHMENSSEKEQDALETRCRTMVERSASSIQPITKVILLALKDDQMSDGWRVWVHF